MCNLTPYHLQGSGIGRETAIAYANAGAARLFLLGRTDATLRDTASSLPSHTSTQTFSVDVTQEDALQTVATVIGTWDVLILAAGYVSDPTPIASANIDAWWQNFEVTALFLSLPLALTLVQTNTKATFLSVKAFLPTRNASHATVLAVTTGVTALPCSMVPGHSAYSASKLAQTKIVEFLASEQPDIFAATVHPGLVETAIFTKSGGNAKSVPVDKG